MLVFLGPPLAAALIASFLLYLPFAAIRFPSSAFRVYWTARLIVALGLLAGPLILKLTGEYALPPPGTHSLLGGDGSGLLIFWLTTAMLLTGIISIFELSFVLGSCLDRWKRQNPKQKPGDLK